MGFLLVAVQVSSTEVANIDEELERISPSEVCLLVSVDQRSVSIIGTS